MAELDDTHAAASLPAEVVTPDVVVAPDGSVERRSGAVAIRDRERIIATPIPTADDADDVEPGSEVDPDSAAAAEPAGVRVRGWAGRGPVGLQVIKPPKWVKDRAGVAGGGRKVWRFVTAAELDGRRRTNATWFRFGTKAFAWSDRMPPRWSAYPRVFRMLVRWATLAAVAALVGAWLRWPTPTAWATGMAGWLVLASCGWAATDSLLGWAHRRAWVWPLHRALHSVLGYPERTPPRRYLFVPKGFAQAGGQVEVALPPGFIADGEDGQGKAVANVVRRKLSLGDATESWRLTGPNHFLVIRPRFHLPIPPMVWAHDPRVLEMIEAQMSGAPLLGCTSGWAPVATNLDTESPHGLYSIGSGGGKSETLKGQAAQLMHGGADVTILDFKYTSHEWARGLAHIARDLESIHLALVALGAEGHRRNMAAEAAKAAGEALPFFRRHVLLVEEANITFKLLQLWWDTFRRQLTAEDAGRYGDPSWSVSPAKVALLGLMSMGRERRMHVLLVAQLATSNALGGPEIREQFHSRILGRATAKAWGMLAPEIQPAPVCSRRRGRLYVVAEGRVIETQGARWTDEHARAWATSGDSVVARSRGREGGVSLATRPRPVASTPASGGRELVDLRKASTNDGDGIGGTTYQMLRKLSHQDPEFPDPVERSNVPGVAHLYDPEDLRLWARNRPAQKGRRS